MLYVFVGIAVVVFYFAIIFWLQSKLLYRRSAKKYKFFDPSDNKTLHGLPYLGSAVSGYQCEGSNLPSNWTEWERQFTDPVRHCGNAVNSWQPEIFDVDLKCLKDIGGNIYRFSIEWSRVEPSPNEFDFAAIREYGRRIELVRKAGVLPIVTLYHFVEPLWFSNLGGWKKIENVSHFVRYVTTVVSELRAHSPVWCTINEPVNQALHGYAIGDHPPGIKDLKTAVIVLTHLMHAHVQAYHAIHSIYRAKSSSVPPDNRDRNPNDPRADRPIVMTAHAVMPTRAKRWWYLPDVIGAYIVDQVYNAAFFNMIRTGHWHAFFPPFSISCDIPNAKGALDWIGLNHYTHACVRLCLTKPLDPLAVDIYHPEKYRTCDMGWDVNVQFLEESIYMVRTLDVKLPICITETGSSRPVEVQRYFLENALKMLWHIADHVDSPVLGVCWWTLMDNFEWERGWLNALGLYATEGDRRKRIPTELTPIFREFCELNRRVGKENGWTGHL